MQFLNPNMLWALFLATIPIIIHLFNFRRYKTIYFSNVRLLQDIKKETKKYSQLKNLLLLIIRTLAIVFLVLAFARPFIPLNKNSLTQKQTIVGIYIDNSFSMEATGKYGILLEQAKMKALNIAKAYPIDTRFLLTTNNFEPKHMQLVGSKQFAEWVSQIKVSHNIRNIKQIQQIQQNIFLQNDTTIRTQQYIISDFQKNIFDKNFYINNKNIHTTLVPLVGQKSGNVYIDSVWFDSPGHFVGKQEKIKIKIVNYANNDVKDLKVNLWINDSLKSMITIDIPENEDKIFDMNFVQSKQGINTARLELSDYPITFDNTLYFSFLIANKIQVLELYKDNDYPYIKALFDNDSNYNFSKNTLHNIKYENINNSSVIFANDIEKWSSGLISKTQEAVKNGATLILMPSVNTDIKKYNSVLQHFTKTRISNWAKEKGQIQGIDLNHQYFKNAIQKNKNKIRMPIYNGFYRTLLLKHSKADILFKSESGYPIITKEPMQKGTVVFITIPLTSETSDFVTHPIFVPLFYNIALYSTHFSNLYFTINTDMNIFSNKTITNELIKIKDKNKKIEIIPEIIPMGNKVKLAINENKINAGNLFLDVDNKSVDVLSFNYDRKESKNETCDYTQLRNYTKHAPNNNVSIITTNKKELQKQIQQQTKGKSLVIIFLCLIIVLLIAEMLIARLMY